MRRFVRVWTRLARHHSPQTLEIMRVPHFKILGCAAVGKPYVGRVIDEICANSNCCCRRGALRRVDYRDLAGL